MSVENIILQAWEDRNSINKNSDQKIILAINETLENLDSGTIRVCEKKNNEWHTHQWIQKAILLSFKTQDNKMLSGPYAKWFDKVDGKTALWDEKKLLKSGFRAVPNGVIRKSAYIGKNVVLMPSFINVGAYVDDGTMIDTWSTVGSCAQIGKNCHISGGVGIGGVLEPLQANPVIIEDNCFVGARSEVAEGVIVGEGSVISMGVYLGASTKIIDRKTNKIIYGKVPPYSVIVSGTLANEDKNKPSLYCAVIVKTVDEKTRSKTSINDLLRD